MFVPFHRVIARYDDYNKNQLRKYGKILNYTRLSKFQAVARISVNDNAVIKDKSSILRIGSFYFTIENIITFNFDPLTPDVSIRDLLIIMRAKPFIAQLIIEELREITLIPPEFNIILKSIISDGAGDMVIG